LEERQIALQKEEPVPVTHPAGVPVWVKKDKRRYSGGLAAKTPVIAGQVIANRLVFAHVREKGTLMEVVVRTVLHVSAETLTALLYIASAAVVLGSVVIIYTQTLRIGLLLAATAFISGALGFLYSVWRLYRPRTLLSLRA
jgi:FtsH-binding integral membrane protein